MKLSEIGTTGQVMDVLNGGDVGPDGRLLSVAELQQGFRTLLLELRAQPRTAPTAPVTRADSGTDRVSVEPIDSGAAVDSRWISVLAAHSGAGASTVALAVADAAVCAGRVAHLIETVHPSRSGLVAASSSELGLDSSGSWRRGLRGQITIDRRAGDAAPVGWPAMVEAAAPTTVVDLGLPSIDNIIRLATEGATCVLVSRATVSGVRLAEHALDVLASLPVVVAVLGPGRWPGEVTASLGPRLRRLRADGQTVTVPLDRRIEVTGPSRAPLPKSVLRAGRSLLGLIDATHPDDVPTAVPPAPRPKGTTR